MSDFTTVKKQQLRNYGLYQFAIGLFLGCGLIAIASELAGSNNWLAGVVYLLIAAGLWYTLKDEFPVIRQAIEDARGDPE